MKVKDIVTFLVGVAVGLIGGIIITDIYYKKAVDESIEEFKDSVSSYLGKEEETEDTHRKNNVMKRDTNGKIAYHKMYSKSYEDEEKDFVAEEEEIEMKQFHDEHFDDDPKIISDISDAPEWYEKQTLFYYQYSDTLVNETDNSILTMEDIDELFRDLLSISFTDDEEEVIQIMNYRTDTVYRIEKMFAAYEDPEVIADE